MKQKHLLQQITQGRTMIDGRIASAVCSCGWSGHAQPIISDAVEEWQAHAEAVRHEKIHPR